MHGQPYEIGQISGKLYYFQEYGLASVGSSLLRILGLLMVKQWVYQVLQRHPPELHL